MHDNISSTSDSVPAVRLEDLSRLLRVKRKAERLTLEQVADKTGVSPATLSRLERWQGQSRSATGMPSAPDTRTLAALTRWLGVSIERVMDVGVPAEAHGLEHASGASTPDIVEAHLRADRHLDAQTAAALARIFRTAYDSMAEQSKTPIE